MSVFSALGLNTYYVALKSTIKYSFIREKMVFKVGYEKPAINKTKVIPSALLSDDFSKNLCLV